MLPPRSHSRGSDVPAPLIVIDDDPTGAQMEAGVDLLLRWSAAEVNAVATQGARVIHLLTNSRALTAKRAYDVVHDAAAAARDGSPGSQVILRGDSTLRAHLLPEHLAVRDALFPGSDPPAVLVPALPTAGRVTVRGIHWIEAEHGRISVADTAYARDAAFSYTSARLLEWAEERSDGHFLAADGEEIDLGRLRGGAGPDEFAAALGRVSAGRRPGAVVPDAETQHDLELVAEGLRRAQADGVESIIRCGPALVGAIADSTAKRRAPLPRVRRGLLVVIGSHVPNTSRQLAELLQRHGDAYVEVQPEVLTGPRAQEVVAAAAQAAIARLQAGRLAIVATARETRSEMLTFEKGMRIAAGLAEILGCASADADVVISKGGITSAVNASHGLQAPRARVVGPIAPGVSLWHLPRATEAFPFIVFPGNVGAPDSLANLVDELLEG
jgi:uncharacterized protein YgbK (DUF1537 family)